MKQTPSGDGACCLPQADGLTYLKVGPRGAVVGMTNLDTIFQKLHALSRQPDEATDAELVGLARRFNYIPDRHSVEADYAAALRQAYAAFCARQEKGREHAAHT